MFVNDTLPTGWFLFDDRHSFCSCLYTSPSSLIVLLVVALFCVVVYVCVFVCCLLILFVDFICRG